MVLFQREYIEKETSLSSDSQTYIKELPRSGLLSALEVRFQATNGSTDNKSNEIWRVLDKIELLGNGSEVIVSAEVEELMRLAWLKAGRFPESLNSEGPSAAQYIAVPILFGRFIGDSKYGLDLAKWNTIDVRVTYNLAAVRAVDAATAYVSGSSVLTIVSHRALAGTFAAPLGYVKTSQVSTFTSAASGDKVVEMPIKNKYIGVGVYAREDGVADNVDITAVKLDLDNGKQVLFTGEWNDVQEANAKMFGVDPETHGILNKSDTDTFYTNSGTVQSVAVEVIKASDPATDLFYVLNVHTLAGDMATMAMSQGDITAAAEDLTAYVTDTPIHWTAKGVGVGNFAYVPIDLPKDFTGILDSTEYSQVDMVLTQGGAGAKVNVVLEELVSY